MCLNPEHLSHISRSSNLQTERREDGPPHGSISTIQGHTQILRMDISAAEALQMRDRLLFEANTTYNLPPPSPLPAPPSDVPRTEFINKKRRERTGGTRIKNQHFEDTRTLRMKNTLRVVLGMAFEIQTTADLVMLANTCRRMKRMLYANKFKAAIQDIINDVETLIQDPLYEWPCQQEASQPPPPPPTDVSLTVSQDQEAIKLPPPPTDVSLTVSQDQEANQLPPASSPVISQSCGGKYNGYNSRRGRDGQKRRRRSPVYSYIRSPSLPDGDLKKRRPFNKNSRNRFRTYSSNWRGRNKRKKKLQYVKFKLPGSKIKINLLDY